MVRRREGCLLQALQELLFGLGRALSQVFIGALELLHAVQTGDWGSVTATQRDISSLRNPLTVPLICGDFTEFIPSKPK
jgi:hypothetical protein